MGEKISHSDLINEFCKAQDHTKWMLFTEPVLGVRTDSEARPDVLMISKSWSNYEVRICIYFRNIRKT